MRRELLWLLLLGIGCAHAKQVETPTQAKPEPAPKSAARPSGSPPPPGHPAVTATPGSVFEPGAVRKIQNALRERGFRAPETGALDQATRGQISLFQKLRSLPDTGFPDDLTIERLGLDPSKLHRARQ